MSTPVLHCLTCGEVLGPRRRIRCGRVRCEKYRQQEPQPKRIHARGPWGVECGRGIPPERVTEDWEKVNCAGCLRKRRAPVVAE